MAVNNDRVTQAVLKQVVENNTKALEKIDKRLDVLDDCLHDLQKRQAVTETKVSGLENRVNTWGGVNSLGAAIAMIMSYLGFKQ